MPNDQPSQNFANHTRYDPPFHFFIVPVVIGNFIVAAVHLYRFPSGISAWLVVVALAAVVAAFKIRLYPLNVQDRVIRLEERLRLTSVLQEPLRSRIGELSDTQLVGLRFASDAELPGLVQRCLADKLSRADIKKSVTNWRADSARV